MPMIGSLDFLPRILYRALSFLRSFIDFTCRFMAVATVRSAAAIRLRVR